jgi:hypothetical protein
MDATKRGTFVLDYFASSKRFVMKKAIKLVRGLLLFVCAFVILVSCKKDKDNSPPKTKTDLLTTGTWRYVASTVNPAYDYYGTEP